MKNLIPFVFQKKLFVYLFFGFIIAAVIGTLSHECGHYVMLQYYGYSHVKIGYKYTTSGYRAGAVESKQTDAITTAAGPIETMLAGTIGIFVLLIFRKRYKQADSLALWQWIIILVSLSWLRELFNLCCALVLSLKDNHRRFYGDEFRLSRMMGYSQWVLPVITGAIAAIILAVIVFRYVPVRQRFTLIVAGLIGGLIGAWLWLVALGPKLMP